MKRIVLSAFAVLLLSPVFFTTESHPRQQVSKTYWLRYSLIFFYGCVPRVSRSKIVFNEGTCHVDAYAGQILPRGSKITLKALNKEKGLARVSLAESSVEYEIHLANDSDESFRKAFNLVFLGKETSRWYDMPCSNHIKTKKQVINCLGFPISASKDKDVEEFFYILEFVGPSPFSSYDGFTIKMKNGKVIDVSGYI
jgi:hypothetical protein